MTKKDYGTLDDIATEIQQARKETAELQHENTLLKSAVAELCQTIAIFINVIEKLQKVNDDT